MNEHERNAAEAVALDLTGGMLFGMARALIGGGMQAGSALRLASTLLLVEAFGEDVLHELGVSRATFYRWRAAMKGMDVPENPPQDVMDALVRLHAARESAAAS